MAYLALRVDDVVLGQTGLGMGPFNAGYESMCMVRNFGQKRAREMWFTYWFYSVEVFWRMGLVDTVYGVGGLVVVGLIVLLVDCYNSLFKKL